MSATDAAIFLVKAEESLSGAESEFANSRYNNCANRCYYSCYQAAIYGLLVTGIAPRGQRVQWEHSFVQAAFIGELLNRRKHYPASLRDVLGKNLGLRVKGDYEPSQVTQIEASRALQRVREFGSL
jgi:uncharacterized protein (UPF0332 family)